MEICFYHGYTFPDTISLENIKNFIKTGSITAGHTEFNQSMEIECITGLLWQGVENDVVMAVS